MYIFRFFNVTFFAENFSIQKYIFSESLLNSLQDDLHWENHAQSDKEL